MARAPATTPDRRDRDTVPARYATFEVVVPTEQEDDASLVLWEHGTVGVQVETRDGGQVVLTASFPDGPAIEGALRAALAGATVRALTLPEVDWVARFREDFRAFDASGFTVVPEWDGRTPGERTIVIDPGRAFGTGTHQTTRLCLALLTDEAGRRAIPRVIDVGAGTGILAIAALRLGTRLSVATDFDPEASASAALHARLNQVPLRVVEADGGRPFSPGSFDAVLANLMAPLLIERADELAALGAEDAVLILSGLLTEDVEAVSQTYRRFGVVESRTDGEWAALRVRT
jgi:ribosomal protein L11 methyltransferase